MNTVFPLISSPGAYLILKLKRERRLFQREQNESNWLMIRLMILSLLYLIYQCLKNVLGASN